MNTIEAMEKKVNRLEKALTTLVSWSARELGVHNATTLLNMIAGEPHKDEPAEEEATDGCSAVIIDNKSYLVPEAVAELLITVSEERDRLREDKGTPDPVVVTPKGVEICGSCRHWCADKRWCKRYPPVPKDNRHAWFPVTFWDERCGEWRGRPKDG